MLCNTVVDGTILPAYLGTAAGNTTQNPLTGPDYFFGWGTCNALAAAELLTRNFFGGSRTAHLCEHLLVDRSTIEIPVCHDGVSSKIKVMICLTDPPYQSSSVAGLDDDVTDPETGPADEDRLMGRRRLMNDLDLRVISPDGQTTYQPWVLNPVANPANPLKRSDGGPYLAGPRRAQSFLPRQIHPSLSINENLLIIHHPQHHWNLASRRSRHLPHR